MRPLSIAGLVAFLAAWLLSGVAQAQEVDGAPAPLVEASAYPDYRYQPEAEWSLEEASLGGGESVSIDVDSWGAAAVTLELHGAVDGWPERARDALRSLHTTPAGEHIVRELQGFLRQLERAAQLQGEGWTRYDLCRDGSLPPEEGCALETGGSFSAEVSARPDGVQVVLTDAP